MTKNRDELSERKRLMGTLGRMPTKPPPEMKLGDRKPRLFPGYSVDDPDPELTRAAVEEINREGAKTSGKRKASPETKKKKKAPPKRGQ